MTTSILAQSNGNTATMKESEYAEIGTPGLSSFGGYLMEAYNAKLFWPSVEPLYSRIWRSDPETTIVRTLFSALTGQQDLTWELPQHIGGRELEEPTEDDERLLDFAHTLTVDIQGGLHKWLMDCSDRGSFYGFGVWEMPLGLRSEVWTAPNDGWQSSFNDNLVGIRKIALRDYSSFSRWELDDHTGELRGFWQLDTPNQERLIPIENLLHITYGDHTNPEGLATMEALWRLERILYQYQLIHGIGSEHAAGYVKFTVKEELDNDAKSLVRQAARAVLTAQEGNYITEVEQQFTADIIDTPFQAAGDVLEAIRYYSLLKLGLYGMQFAGMNTMSGTGSYAALQDSSSMALLIFNAMSEGFVKQANEQIGERVFNHPMNAAAFPNATRQPVLKVSRIEKVYSLDELGQFAQALSTVFPLGEDDQIAIRRKSGILPESLPDENTTIDDGAAPAVNGVPGGVSDDNASPENLDTSAGLNGAQITAVLKVLDGVAAGVTPEIAGVELLVAVGMQRPRAESIVKETLSKGAVGIENPERLNMSQWWQLRQDIYSRPDLPHVELIERLDNATTTAELASIRKDI